VRINADARVWIALGVLALLLSIGRTAAPDDSAPEVTPLRSTYRTRPSGLRALYLTLPKLGYTARRHQETLDRLKGDGALVIAEPVLDIAPREWEAVRKWVSRGNLLLLYSDSGHLFAPGERHQTQTPTTPVSTNPTQPAPAVLGAPNHVIQSPYRFDGDSWSPERSEEMAEPFSSKKKQKPAPKHVFPPEPVVTLAADGLGPALSLSRWGKGTVLLSCSPWSISNEGIAKGSNLALFLNLIDAYGAGKRHPVYFDEYHHGQGGPTGVLSLLPPVARGGLAQIVFALLLLVVAVARRFGPMLPAEALERRTRAEYLTAMSLLFRRARALELAAGKLRDEAQRDLARGLGLPPAAGADAIARAAHEKRGVDADRVRRTLEEADMLSVARARHLPIDEGRVLALAAKLHELRKECLRWE
jgi:Domain of unknown function (DUF4350)